MRLLIVSNMEHYGGAHGPVSPWASAIGEIDALATISNEVRHICALHSGEPPPGAVGYRSPNVQVVPVRPTGGRGWRAKAGVVAAIPAYAREIQAQLDWADAVQVRAPSNIAIPALALLAARRTPARRWIKYAGEWNGRPGEPAAYRLQRTILRWNAARARVGVCGPEANSKHLFWVPNPSLWRDQIDRAELETREKRLSRPLELLFAGRLDGFKGADRAIAIVPQLRRLGIKAVLRIAGAGPQLGTLRRRAAEAGVSPQVIFYGWLDRESLHRLYVRAHGIVAPSETEGWPKVLSEAMAHRVVPFAAAVGAVPETLARARAGKALPPGSAGLWASEIAKTAGDAEEWRREADRAQAASRAYSYERYLESARLLLDCPETADSPRGVLAEEVR